jgi:hypothetical protein
MIFRCFSLGAKGLSGGLFCLENKAKSHSLPRLISVGCAGRAAASFCEARKGKIPAFPADFGGGKARFEG